MMQLLKIWLLKLLNNILKDYIFELLRFFVLIKECLVRVLVYKVLEWKLTLSTNRTIRILN